MTAIAFIGSVFSPGYHREGGDPLRFTALNVALYRLGGRGEWIFAEHDGRSARRTEGELPIGRSLLERRPGGVRLAFDEHTSPFPRPLPRRLRGTIEVEGELEGPAEPLALDREGAHLWWPVLPRARVTVDVPSLGLRWSGQGYHDANAGEHPLGRAFRAWSWGRFHVGTRTVVTYDAERRDGSRLERSLCLGPSGVMPLGGALRDHRVGSTGWGIELRARAEAGGRRPRALHTLEDAPFYARHVVETSLLGGRALGVTESLSLDRFASPWVRALLPFRIRRS